MLFLVLAAKIHIALNICHASFGTFIYNVLSPNLNVKYFNFMENSLLLIIWSQVKNYQTFLDPYL